MNRTKTVAAILACAVMLGFMALPKIACAAPRKAALDKALLLAIQKDNFQKTKSLLARGANPNASDPDGPATALMLAAAGGDLRVLSLLLNNGAKVNTQGGGGFTPLLLAAGGNHLAAMRLLLDHGADTEKRDIIGRTVLLRATDGDDLPVIRLLLDRKADVNTREELGFTPLMMAHQVCVAKLLLEKGADIEAKNYLTGGTPLICYSSAGDRGIVRLLLDKGAAINAGDNIHQTALMNCVARCHDRQNTTARLPIIRLLLMRGADVTLTDNRGRTALTLSTQNKQSDVIALLESAGAKK